MRWLIADRCAYFLVAVVMFSSPIQSVGAEPSKPPGPAPETAQVEAVVRAFFAAYETHDLDAAMAQWSPDSPEFATRKELLEELFGATQNVKLHSLQLVRVRPVDDRIRVRFIVNLTGTDRQTGQPSDRLGQLERQAILVRDNDRYRLWSYTPFGANDPTFIERLLKANTAREVDRIIREDYDQPGDEFTGIFSAFFNVGSPAGRLHLLKLDPYQAISTAQFVTNLNSASWTFVAKTATEGESAIQAAGYYQQLAEEVAQHIDDPASRAWCQLQRALIELAQKKWDDARNDASQALRQFESLEITEGLGAANVVLGRIATMTHEPLAADKAFRAAEQFYSVYVVLGTAERKTLGESWAMMRSSLKLRMHQIRQHIRQGDWSEAAGLANQSVADAILLYGPWHESQADLCGTQTWIAICQGDLGTARTWAEKGLNVAEHLYPPGAFEIATEELTVQMLSDLITRPVEFGQRITKSVVASSQAERLRQAKQYAESLQKWDEVIAERQAVLGSKHLFVASAWEARASTAWDAEDIPRALQDFTQACDIYRELEASDSVYRRALRSKAQLLTKNAWASLLDADLDAAIQAYQEVIELESRVVVGEPADVLKLNWVQFDLKQVRQLTQDQRGALRTLKTSAETLFGPGNDSVANSLTESQTLVREIKELVGDDCFFAYGLRKQVALALWQMGAQDEALAELTSILQTLERRGFESDSYEYVGTVVLMSTCYLDRGEIRLAYERFQEVARADNFAAPLDATAFLAVKRLEARLARRLGDYQAAERALFRALLVKKRELISPENPEFYSHKVLLVLDDALLSADKALLEGYGASLTDLGLVYQDAGFLDRARMVFGTVVAIGERLDEPNRSRMLKTALNNLGVVELDLNQLDASQVSLQRSLDIEALVGEDTVRYAQTEANLAVCLHLRGDREAALKRYQHAAEVYEKEINIDPGEWITLHSSISHCRAALGDLSQARVVLDRAMTAGMAVVRDVASFKSDAESSRDRLRIVNLSRLWPGFCLHGESHDVELGWNWQLQVRGIALDQLKQSRSARELLRDKPEIERQVTRAAQLRAEISDLALNPPENLTPGGAKERQARLAAELNSLVSQLNQSLVPVLPTRPHVTIQEVHDALPPGSALIEFTRAPSPVWDRYHNGKPAYDYHYYAWILKGDATSSPELVSLGDADEIDHAIEDLREQLVHAPRLIQETSEKAAELEYCQAAKSAYQRIVAPLQPHVSEVSQWYVLPDGELHRVALETLVDENGTYLLEHTRIAYLTTATELATPEKHKSGGTWIFAAPDYNLTVAQQAETAKQQEGAAHQTDLVKSKQVGDSTITSEVDLRAARREKGWADLPFAAEELAAVKEALISTSYEPIYEFTGSNAIEEALKSVHSPRVLHLATHGFFVEDLSQEDGSGTRGRNSAAVGLQRLMQQANPLLRSGVVLAGANRLGRGTAPADRTVDDGWVTAEEVAALDLSGTELVVLSACETGLGEVRVGEGVAGLRQSFLHAGAHTLVTSLYRVPDESTQVMMKEFYQGLRSGKSKLAALGDAQRAIIQSRRAATGAAHPFYWGSFILVGNPH